MSLDYLEEMERAINNGAQIYATPGQHMNEWHLARTPEELEAIAQRTANSRKYEVSIFRMINRMEAVAGDSYLVVKKIGDPGPRGEPHLQWTLVDTRDAADMLRDVSHGPSPYFGAAIEKTYKPK